MATCYVIAMTSCGLGHHDCDARRRDSPGLHTHKLSLIQICTHPPYPHPTPSTLCTLQSDKTGPCPALPQLAACRTGLAARLTGCLLPPIPLPCCKSYVLHVGFHVVTMCLCAEVFFSCPHTVLPTEHSLRVAFFLLPFSPHVMLLFLNCPVFQSCLSHLSYCCMFVCIYVVFMYGLEDGLISLYLILVTNKGY